MTWRDLHRSPLFWILAGALLLRVSGLFWGLPHADGWDDDGFAPRNFLTALALTWKPGSFFTYPPLHAVLLALLNLPVVVMALLHMPSFSQADVVGTITQPFTMTWFSVTARLVAIAMSLGIIWTIARMTELLAGRRAGLLAASACALGVGFTYYGQVSNLDVPYLFWSLLALLALMRGMTEQAPRRFWHAALLMAAALATKDQAYGLFLLSLPVGLLLWFAGDAWPRQNAQRVLGTLLAAGVVAGLGLALLDGAITNPSGFAKRIAFLTGPASRDYAAYAPDLQGWLDLLRDMVAHFGQGTSMIVVLLVLAGVFLCWRDRSRRAAGLLPFLAIVSFTLCFNFAALRSDVRFLLPQAVLASIYVGIAADRLLGRVALRRPAQAMLTVLAIFAGFQCVAVSASMWRDPRYDAEAWMRAHVGAGETIETYGQNAYLPRFPANAAVTRIGQRPLKQRNPLPHVREILAPYEGVESRAPRFIVVNDWWLRHYTHPESELGGHRQPSAAQQALFRDPAAHAYFTALRDGRLRYRLVHAAAPRGDFWPQPHIHESLNETILIFERTP